jgi:hypothetical protein
MYTKATLPAASGYPEGSTVAISDGTVAGGPLVYSDTAVWRYVSSNIAV